MTDSLEARRPRRLQFSEKPSARRLDAAADVVEDSRFAQEAQLPKPGALPSDEENPVARLEFGVGRRQHQVLALANEVHGSGGQRAITIGRIDQQMPDLQRL